MMKATMRFIMPLKEVRVVGKENVLGLIIKL
jgi:hypothetical protein